MSEHHAHFRMEAAKGEESPYRSGDYIPAEALDAWMKHVTARMAAMVEALREVPLDPSKPLHFSITVKQ